MVKVLRSIFVMLFISMLVVVPAQAQTAGEYRFLPLVTQADPSVPLAVQAQQAFNRLLPDLLAARQHGTILSFQPDFSAGILQVEYSAGGRAALPTALQGSDDINAAAALVPHETPAAVRRWITITPVFSMSLYSSCFSASGLGANSHIIGSLRDTTGRVIANVSGTANSSGALFNCFSYGPFALVQPGFKITFNVYDTSAVLLGTFSTAAPKIVFAGFNKKTSVVTGTGPKNAAYSIEWSHPNLDAGETTLDVTKTGMVSSTGKWTAHLGAPKLRGGDYLNILVSQNPVFVFERYFYLPSTYCTPGGAYCYINGFAFQPATLTMIHAGVVHTFTGNFGADEYFSIYMTDANGNPLFMKPGDTISGSGIAAYKLPQLTAAPISTSVVSGKAPANKYLEIWARDVAVSSTWYKRWVQTDSAGNYSADFSGSLVLTTGDPLSFEGYYTDPVTGNITDQLIAVGP